MFCRELDRNQSLLALTVMVWILGTARMQMVSAMVGQAVAVGQGGVEKEKDLADTLVGP